MKNIFLGLLVLSCFLNNLSGQSYLITYNQDAGNPGGINTDSYSSSTGWTEISGGGQSTNEWLAPIAIPFAFDFYGSPVTHLMVSHNMVATFDTTATLVPGDNVALPSATLPNKSIACFWDAFTTSPPLSTLDDIDYKEFGTAPNRQFWIRWYGYELNGNTNVHAALVLEETTNKIYVVDLYSSNSSGLSATVGVQLDATTGTDVGFNLTVSGNATTTPDNDYYEFLYVPAGVCLPPLDVAVKEYTSTSTTLVWNEFAVGSTFEIEYGPVGFSPGTGTLINGITDTFHIITGLTSYTDYDLYIAEDCPTGNLSAQIGPVSILTAAASGWKETFTGTFIPNGWSEAQGLISNPTSFTSTSAGWAQDEFSNIGTNDAANELISGSSQDDWLISPSIELLPSHNLNLEFDLSLTVSAAKYIGNLASDDTIHVVISLDNGNTWNRSNALLTLDENSTLYADGGAHFTIPLSAYTGIVKIGFYAESTITNLSSDLFIDNVQIRPAVSCPQPFGFTASNITATSIDLEWQTSGGSNFQIIWGPTGFTQATNSVNTTGSTYTLSGLDPYTAYDIRIWNDCGSNNSDTVSINSIITAIQPVWLEDFNGSTFPPFGWDEKQGEITDSTIFSSYSSGWLADDFANNTSGSNAARETVSSTSDDEWLFTPLIDLGTGTSYQLEFDAALTNSGGINTAPLGVDDTLRIVISTDAGKTWARANSLFTYYTGTEPAASGNHYLADLSAYAGVVQLGFYSQSSVTNASTDWFIDNVEVKLIPSCPAPFNLSASGDADSVTINWAVLSPSTPYTLSYGPVGFVPGSGTQITGILDTFVTVNGLSANTTYQFYVLGDCSGSPSQYAGPVTYTTPCDVFIAPFTENFDTWTAGTGTATAGDSISVCWDRDPNTTSAYSWRVRTGTTPSTATTGPDQDHTSGSGNYVFTEGSSGSSGAIAIISMPLINISGLNFPSLEFYYHMYGDDIDRLIIEVYDGTNIFTESIIGEQQTANSDPWELFRLNLAALPLASDTIQVQLKAVRGTSLDADMAIDDFEIKEATVCGVPMSLFVQNITSNSADLGWSSGSGLSNIEWGPAGFAQGSGTGNVISNVTSPYSLSGLTPNTDYDFYVQDTCATLSSNSNWVGPFTFTTRCTSVLNGTYTIGGSAGPTNYPTLDSAVQVLNDCGISGPVIFEVAAGTYNETVTINQIVGASAVNTITFTGNGIANSIISHNGSSSSATIVLNGTDYIRFRNFTISNTKNSSEAVCIFLTNSADHNIIDSCSFVLPNTDSETSHIFAGDVLTSINSSANGINASDLKISNSHFDGGNNNIIISGNDQDVTTTSGFIIENNVFTGFDDVALSIADVNMLNILGDSVNSPIGRYAFDLDNIYNYNISGNYIRNLNTVATFSIFSGNVSTAVPLIGRSIISNNIIHSTGNWSLFLFDIHFTDVVNNTLYSDESDALYLSSVDNLKVLNNIMYAPKGEALTFSGGAPPTITNEVDYNIYFPYRTANYIPANPVIVDGSTQYTLAEWQAVKTTWDQNSKLGDPEFISATNLHVQGFLADNAGTPVTGVTEDYDGETRNTTTPDIGADEFTATTCPMPTTLDIQNVTGTTADLIWLGSGSSYNVEWDEGGFVPGSGTQLTVSTTTASISSLTPGIVYDYYVRNACSPNPSDWAGPFSFVTTCGTPLSGTYSINQSLPSSSTNFSSVKTAALALAQCGVSGPVTFNIVADTYNGPVIFGAIPGSSATNTITFTGASTSGVIISSNGSEVFGNQATILLDSTDHVTFRNVTIQNTASSDAWGVLLTHAADHNSFINCYFDMPVTTGADVAGLIASNSAINDNSTGTNASYILIDSCHFYGGEKGVVIDGTSSGFGCTNLQISNSIFELMDEHGIDINEMDTVRILNNTISGIVDISTSYGIEMDDVNNFIVSGNNINVGDEGISIDDGNESNIPTVYSEISNNMIIAGADHAADIIDVSYVNIFHNSLVGEPAIEIDDHDFMVIKNNIFYGRGAEAFLSADVLGSLTKVEIDYNLYYGTSSTVGPIGISSTDYADLAAWVAADNTRNSNSIEGDPAFIDVTNDLHMEQPIADGVGDNSVGITVDIDGDIRPLPGSTIVDIGADEYIPNTCFTPDSLEAIGILPTSIQLGWVSGGSNAWQILYGPEGFTPGTGTLIGTTTNPHTITGLTEASCYEFYVRDSCSVGDVSGWHGPIIKCTDYSCTISSTPALNGDTVLCAPQIDTLYGTSNEDMLIWLNSKGYIVHQGDTLITDTITVDTTIYAADAGFNGPQFRHVGPLPNIATAGFGNFSNGMMFTTFKTIMLDSLTLKSDGARSGNIRIWEPDSIDNDDIDVSKATLIQEVPYTLTAAGEWQVPVGIALSPGKYFINLSFDAGSGLLFRATSGAQFPYVLDNMISIDSSVGTSNFPLTRVYYFFDWVVSGMCAGPQDSLEIKFGGSPTASFTSTVSSVTATNATVDFDASASASGIINYIWDFGDGQTGSGITPQHIYTANGTYTVELVVITACDSDTIINQVVIQGISLEENILSRSLQIFPTPTSARVTVSFEADGAQSAIIRLLDLSGRTIRIFDAANINGRYSAEYDLSELADGVYMLSISAGELSTTKQVIKQ